MVIKTPHTQAYISTQGHIYTHTKTHCDMDLYLYTYSIHTQTQFYRSIFINASYTRLQAGIVKLLPIDAALPVPL